MFHKILIANRGEIACRIIKTAKAMNIATVAVFSEADKNALHVQMADEALCIGAAPSAQSYLVIKNIIDAAHRSGAQAIHPGYGFLSENAIFTEALEQAGLIFIGPSPQSIRQMGDKIRSKQFASHCGVSIVPGYSGVIPTTQDALHIARDIGYPVMIKASAGGGGKGMRIARSDEDVKSGFDLAASEARVSFGDDRIFIEKFIENPRHIEIQVLGDRYGNIIHLGERECSIQRRNQKIIEEAPSSFLDPEMRAHMGAQAVALAKAMTYYSAGTVEFIVDENRQFYFLEMNTRLQVEHPVTELVTGLDLVEQMIRIAAGEKLALRQEDVALSGSAIECRICAEDPTRDFMPSTGRLKRFSSPQERKQGGVIVRHDCGVYEGDEITLHYDPLVSKLIVHAPDREQATQTMIAMLDEFYCDGVQTNLLFLSDLLQSHKWKNGLISTDLIAKDYPEGFDPQKRISENRDIFLCVMACLHYNEQMKRAPQFFNEICQVTARMNGRFYPLTVANAEQGRFHIQIQDENSQAVRDLTVLQDAPLPNGLPQSLHFWRGAVNGQKVCVQVSRQAHGSQLSYHGVRVIASLHTNRQVELLRRLPEKKEPDLSHYVLCPMPGLLLSLCVSEGQQVKAGDLLCIVEAMKMQNTIRSERAGVIKKISARGGEILSVDAVIMEFETSL